MKAHTKTCAKFRENPELVKLLPARRSKSSKNQRVGQSIFRGSETVNITVKVEPTIDPDVNIKVESVKDTLANVKDEPFDEG